MADIPLPKAFHLSTASGERFCIYHQAKERATRTAILYIHPFAEEMNKSRRMANLQSRALAATGYSVLQLDLNGCGDSSGDFGDATWQSWLDDISLAWDWLQARHQSVFLWGLRLGATLAFDFANVNNRWPSGFLIWQPVLNGEIFMSQFLRLRVASEMMEGVKAGGVQVLRDSLKRGESVEVAGYRLNPELVHQIDSMQVRKIIPKSPHVCWLEIVAEKGQTASPVATQTKEIWRQAQIDFTFDTVVGPAFWATQEIVDCPALIQRTIDYMELRSA